MEQKRTNKQIQVLKTVACNYFWDAYNFILLGWAQLEPKSSHIKAISRFLAELKQNKEKKT